MKAAQLQELEKPLQWVEIEAPTPAPDAVLVRLKAAALNRRDYWITQGLYPGVALPAVLGSDGAGVIEQVGTEVSDWKEGDEVVINPGLNWGDDENAQQKSFQILGMPGQGTFAEAICVPAAQVYRKPAHLTFAQAAALPLAGVTAYRALFRQAELQAGERLLITGIGGGVSALGLQMAVAAGAEVAVTSSKLEKLAWAQRLGAKAAYLYTEEDWHKQLKKDFGPVDLVLDSGGGDQLTLYTDLVRAGGRIVIYGATGGGARNFDPFRLFWKQLRLIGSSMGSPKDFAAMLDFVTEKKLLPEIGSSFALSAVNEALAQMAQSAQTGKIVLTDEAS